MLALMAQRKANRAEILAQQEDLIGYFGQKLGYEFAVGSRVYELLHHVAYDSLLAVMHFKAHFARARPWQHLPALAPMVTKPGHPAYPSGHATQATALARTLARLLPGCADRLAALAGNIGLNREIGGVHYRSDTVAGEKLGRDLFDLVAGEKRFRSLIKASEQELVAARSGLERRCRQGLRPVGR